MTMSPYDYFLGELLAVIHHDGGHYQAEHGAKKATADAIEIIHADRAAIAAAEQRGYERAVAERAWALECAGEMRISIIKFLGGEDAALEVLFNQKRHRQNRISLASIAMAYEVAYESIEPATA